MNLTQEQALLKLADVLPVVARGRFILADSSVEPEAGCLCPHRARMFVILDGTRVVRLGHNGALVKQNLTQGDIMYCNPHTWHRGLLDHKYYLMSIIFDHDYTLLTWKYGGLNQAEDPHMWLFGPHHGPTLQAAVQALNYLTPEQEEAGKGLAQSVLQLIAWEVATVTSKPRRAYSTLRALQNYVEENCHHPINRQSVAQAFGLHANHVSRLFRQQGGDGFVQYLTHLRMQRASTLLTSSEYSIKEVSRLCGYESPNYFCKVFRSTFGCSPGCYSSA